MFDTTESITKFFDFFRAWAQLLVDKIQEVLTWVNGKKEEYDAL